MSAKARAILLMLLAATIWGLSYPIGRYGLETISPLAMSSFRYLFGAMALFPLAWRWRKRMSANSYFGEDHPFLWLWAGLFCGIALTIGTILQLEGMLYSSAGKAGFLTTLYVSLVPVLAFIAGLIPRPLVWVGLAVGLLGLILLTDGDAAGGTFNNSDGLLVVADIFWAMHVLLCGIYALRINIWLFSFAQACACCVMSMVLAIIFGAMPSWHDFLVTLPATGWGVMSIAVAFSCQTMALRDLSATSAALILPLQAVIAAVSGVIFLGETMSSMMIAGAVVLILGSFIAQFAQEPNKSKPEDKNWKKVMYFRVAVGSIIIGGSAFFIIRAFLLN